MENTGTVLSQEQITQLWTALQLREIMKSTILELIGDFLIPRPSSLNPWHVGDPVDEPPFEGRQRIIMTAPGRQHRECLHQIDSYKDASVGNIELYFEDNDSAVPRPVRDIIFWGNDLASTAIRSDAALVCGRNLARLAYVARQFTNREFTLDPHAPLRDHDGLWHRIEVTEDVNMVTDPPGVNVKAIFTVYIKSEYVFELWDKVRQTVTTVLPSPGDGGGRSGSDRDPDNSARNLAEGRDSHAENGIDEQID